MKNSLKCYAENTGLVIPDVAKLINLSDSATVFAIFLHENVVVNEIY